MRDIVDQTYIILPIIVKFLFLFLFFFIIYSRISIINAFRGVGKRTWIILSVILFLSIFMRFFWIPHEQVAGYDGEDWVVLAMNINDYGKYNHCGIASSEQCILPTKVLYPPGYHVSLSIFFKIFGATEKNAFYFSSLLGVMIIFLVFLFSFLWIKNQNIAIATAFTSSIIPSLLKFSGGVTLQLFSVFLLLLTFIFLKIFLDERKEASFFLFLISLLCFVYIRPENIFLIPLFFIIVALQRDIKIFFSNKSSRFIFMSFLTFLFLLFPSFTLIYTGVFLQSTDGWNSSLKETIHYFLNHALKNIGFLFHYKVNLLLFNLIAIVGIVESFLRKKRDFIIFFSIFIFYFLLYSAFDIGNFYWHGRYSLILFVPLFYFFAVGLEWILKISKTEILKKSLIWLGLIIFFFNFYLTFPYIFKEYNNNLTKTFLVSIENQIPQDAYILSANTVLTRIAIKRNAVDLSGFNEKNNYFNDKEVFLLIEDNFYYMKEGGWGNDGVAWIDFIYENYDLIPANVILKNDREEGLYKIIKKN